MALATAIALSAPGCHRDAPTGPGSQGQAGRAPRLSAGSDHTCGLTPDGSAYCWGANGSGQLGDGTTPARLPQAVVSGGVRFQSLSAGDDYTCGLDAGGLAYCWGANGSGQLGDGTLSESSDARCRFKVACGSSRSRRATPTPAG